MKRFFYYLRRGLVLLTVLLTVVAAGGSSAAYAISQETLNSIMLGTPFYDTTAEACSSGQTVLNGGDNIQKAYNFFVTKGLNAMAASAVTGNLDEESSLIPTVIQNPPGGTTNDPSWIVAPKYTLVGWGIAQWTPGAKALDVAKGLGITGQISDLTTQLEMVWGQMTDTSPTGDQNMAIGLIKLTQNIPTDPTLQKVMSDNAVEYFRANFEGGDKNIARQGDAWDIFTKYGNTTVTAASACGIQCNTSAGTTSAALSNVRQNVVCLAIQELNAWNTIEQTTSPWMQYTKYSAGSIGLGWSKQDASGNRTVDGNGLVDNQGDVYDGYQWCAAFVSWVYKTAGDPFTGGYQNIPWRLSVVDQIRSFGEQKINGFVFHNLDTESYTPRPGDIIIFKDLETVKDPKTGQTQKVWVDYHTALVSNVTTVINKTTGQPETTITEIGGDQAATHGYFGGPLNTAVVSSWSQGYKDGIAGYVSPDN